jgi:mono/diheme cytochrome c family protein
MRVGRIVAGVVLVLLLVGGGLLAYAWTSAIAPIDPPARSAFDEKLIARGAELAAIGNCNVCHTAPGGKLFAGGLDLPTPFGTIFSTNITPEPETGIGRWSQAAFDRSMRQGVDREGRHLYPAFPYDHFTLVSDEDLRALYAFLMTREPVKAEAKANALPFPYDQRMLLAGWKLLHLREGPYRPDPARSADWNRGAYLAEGLGHCGACHTPRNRFGAEERDRHFDGGEVEGWYAYALDKNSPAPVPWTVDSLDFYFRNGWQEAHGISRGPMAPVTTNLAAVPEADVRAIATYVAAQMGEPDAERRRKGEAALAAARDPAPVAVPPGDLGAALYASACAACHDGSRPLPFGGIDLHLSTGVTGPTPTNLVNVALFGLPPAEGEQSPMMPGFADTITDAQLEALVTFIRARFSGGAPAWAGIGDAIARARRGEVVVRASDGISSAPANPRLRGLPW